MLPEIAENNYPYLRDKRAKSTLWVIVADASKTDVSVASGKFGWCTNKASQLGNVKLAQLDQTWQKAKEITKSSLIITTTNAKDKKSLKHASSIDIPGKLIFHPGGYGTAASVYLALAHILAKDPEARVVILPIADYYQEPDTQVKKYINQAAKQLEEHPQHALLLASFAQTAVNRSQWLEVSSKLNSSKKYVNEEKPIPIAKFHNKPRTSIAKRLEDRDTLISTGIVVSKADLLWHFCQRALPDLYEKMEYVYQVITHFKGDSIGDDYIRMATSHAFYQLPVYNFYNDLINRCLNNFRVLPMKACRSNLGVESIN